jgi:hypothetical protein
MIRNQGDSPNSHAREFKKAKKQHCSASFSSKVPRLAPAFACQGLASEVIPSSIENPGPGSYAPTNLEIASRH